MGPLYVEKTNEGQNLLEISARILDQILLSRRHFSVLNFYCDFSFSMVGAPAETQIVLSLKLHPFQHRQSENARPRLFGVESAPYDPSIPPDDPSHLRPVILKPVGRIFEISDSNLIQGKCGKCGRPSHPRKTRV